MNLSSFFREFVKRKGLLVLVSSVIEKVGGLLIVFIATNLISKGEYGLIIYANTSLMFIMPFLGFGIHQSLIRYGSLSNSQIDKKYLFNIVLRKGLKYSSRVSASLSNHKTFLNVFFELNLLPLFLFYNRQT